MLFYLEKRPKSSTKKKEVVCVSAAFLNLLPEKKKMKTQKSVDFIMHPQLKDEKISYLDKMKFEEKIPTGFLFFGILRVKIQ